MRRPRFNRWIRSVVLSFDNKHSFNLRKLAARVQRNEDARFTAAVLLCAYEDGHADRLLSYIYCENIAEEYKSVLSKLGNRSVERLALRGTPMMSLPSSYRQLLADFEEAFYEPERISEIKKNLWERSHADMLISGCSPTEIARSLHLDPSNLSAYLKNADTGRFTLETTQAIADYLSEAAAA